MRILMLTWEYPPRVVGGIARVVNELSKRLAAQGHEVHVITWLESNNNQFEIDEGVYVHRVHTYNIQAQSFVDWVMHLNFAMIEKGAELVQKLGKFDIIHAHDWLAMYSAKTLKHAYHIPLVSTIHATEYGRNHGIHDGMQKYINDAEWLLTYESWKIICNSDYMKNEIAHIFSTKAEKIEMIPNGIDIHKFDGVKKDMEFRRNYASDKEKIIMFAGRLVQEKGIHILIEAITKVMKYYKDIKVVIAGKGPKYDDLVEHATRIGVVNKIYFTGHMESKQLYKLYKCADVAVFPSLYEPFGLVAIESMLAGIPVVVSDTGGLGEIVEHNINGIKSYTGNSESLADSILEVLFNEDKNKIMTENAKEKVLRLYNWDKIAKQTSKVYEEVHNECLKNKWGTLTDDIGEDILKERELHKKAVVVKEPIKKVIGKTKTTKKTVKKMVSQKTKKV